ncbi:MAG: hypothetical protein WD060_04950 [Pirellulales bacterium]
MGLDLEGMLELGFLTRDHRPCLREPVVPHEFALHEVEHVPGAGDWVMVVHQADLIGRLPQGRGPCSG